MPEEPFFLSWPILLVSAYVKSCLNTSVAAPLIPQVQKKKNILPVFMDKLMSGFLFYDYS